MPLSLKTVKGVVSLTWSSPTMEASWKIRPSMTEAEMMDTLCRVVIFVNSQNRELGKMEYELIKPQAAAAAPVPPAAQGSATPAPETGTTGRILMQPPQAGNDRPSDGGPPAEKSMFEALPTTTVPAELQSIWEMAPPEEQSW